MRDAGEPIMTVGRRRTIILLTGEREKPFFETFLKRRNPDLEILFCNSRETLDREVARRSGDVRLIAFLTDLIVPATILERLTITPYNIHPGPPEYPGSHPDSFAIWEDASHYGVTAHEMTERVDEGPIVLLDVFEMPAPAECGALTDLAYARAVDLFSVLGAHCAISDGDLPRLPVTWSGRKRTKQDFRKLRSSLDSLSPAHRDRLMRALPEMPAGERDRAVS